MTGVTPPAGAGSPCGTGSGAAPALSGRLNLSGWIVGLSSPFIGALGARPAGVALRLASSAPDDAFEIALVDDRGETLMTLGQFGEDDVVASWRGLGAVSGFPLLTQGKDGALQSPFPQIGRVQLGEIRIRRGHGLLKGRRPRFLLRRKTARLPRRPVIHREREIIGADRS